MKKENTMKTPIALTIAASDSSGGAGIPADIKSMSALGVYSATVFTALTAQNTKEVRSIFPVSLDFVTEQIQTVFDDIAIDAVKIGMLGTADITETVAKSLKAVEAKNIVLDPVMVAKSGDRLLTDDVTLALKEYLIPMSDIITPNLPEASEILGVAEANSHEQMQEITRQLLSLGSKSVLLKGGHLQSDISHDVFFNGEEMFTLSSPRIKTKNTHGTGCTMSSAIASFLAKGDNMEQAVRGAKKYIAQAVEHSDKLHIGSGHGPVHHFYDIWDK